jgi:hypothetical protein
MLHKRSSNSTIGLMVYVPTLVENPDNPKKVDVNPTTDFFIFVSTFALITEFFEAVYTVAMVLNILSFNWRIIRS